MVKLICIVISALLIISCYGIDVNELLASMTLEEKVGQMTQLDLNLFIDSSTAEVDYDKMADWFATVEVNFTILFYSCNS